MGDVSRFCSRLILTISAGFVLLITGCGQYGLLALLSCQTVGLGCPCGEGSPSAYDVSFIGVDSESGETISPLEIVDVALVAEGGVRTELAEFVAIVTDEDGAVTARTLAFIDTCMPAADKLEQLLLTLSVPGCTDVHTVEIDIVDTVLNDDDSPGTIDVLDPVELDVCAE